MGSFFKKIIFLCLLVNTSVFAIELTEQEKKWLQQHPQINIAFDNQMPPFEWRENKGHYQGISVDIIELLAQQLNIKFNIVDSKNWSELLTQFRQQKIDVIPAIVKSEKRKNFMLFTESYNSIAGVIISDKQYNSVNDLSGEKIGVVSDYIWDDLITQYDDEIHIVRVETTQDGIELAALGAIDAMISDLASVSYYIENLGISNLYIVPLDSNQKQKISLAFSMGIRKDWPQLQSILQKALNALSKEDKDRIFNKWIKLQSVSFWQTKEFWLPAIILTGVVVLIIVLIILWNHALKLQVAQRSKQLEKAQKQLIHAEKMESIGRLSAGIAHEVKNPLAILQMSVDYLKGEDNDATIKTILTDMDDAINRADTVIKGLLDFSRETELEVKYADINEVISASFKLIEHETKQHNIKVSLTLAQDLPALAMDKNRLQQVFINLFMNAIQAIGSQGEINVYSKLTYLSDPRLIDKSEGIFTLQQQVIEIQFIDSGCGLEKKNEKNVFEPFFTTKPVGEGTGLGLSVSKKIIALHHGMITMNNRVDNIQGVEVKLLFAINGEALK